MAVPAIAAAGDPAIAKAVDVRPEATGLYNGGTVVLSAQDDLFEGQTITTGAQGQVQIVFADDTRMVVGPGSSLIIEKYLMRNGGTASAFAVSALGGTFRFITGKSNKSVYKIDTPTGTIGVRGTRFDFTVDKIKKKTNIVLFDGEVTYCPNTGGCTSVKGKCDVGLGEDSDAEIVGKGGKGHASATSKFIYVKSQGSLKSDFKVRGAGECGAVEETTQAKQEAKVEDPGPSKSQGKPDPIPDPLPD
ncbi:MAG: FecR domain-containing protein [Devosia sp.]